MPDIHIDPDVLPSFDIVMLANSGALLRAEAETPPNGVPAFVTAAGWRMIEARYRHASPEELLTNLGRATHRLLAHAAEAYAETDHSDEISAPGSFSCPSDLFENNGTLHLAFIRDTTHPVICAVIGTNKHLQDLMKAPFRDDGR